MAARCKRILLAGLTLAIAATPVQASARSGQLADFDLHLSATTPSTPTGLAVDIRFHSPSDPDAKPSPVRSVVLAGPSGLRFDSAAAPTCAASDEELRTLGTGACPPESKVGSGTFTAITGFGPPVDPFVGDNNVFNADNQLIEVITQPGTSVSPGFDRLSIDGSTLTAHPPVTPGGPPDEETSVRSIAFEIPVTTSSGRSLIETPPVCPRSGTWIATGTFGFSSGASETLTSEMPCRSAEEPCTDKRRFTIAAPSSRHTLPRGRLLVNGAVIQRFKPLPHRVPVDLRRSTPGQLYRVRITAHNATGKRRVSRRLIRLCAAPG